VEATARAHSNIALVKYWGKRAGASPELNLPATGSLSMTLSALHTTTTVRFGLPPRQDRLILGGQEADGTSTGRVAQFLDRVRTIAGMEAGAEVISENNFPAASGLASSASAFAALALAATQAAGLKLTPLELSRLARLGSGSAARSIFGGFVEMHAGSEPDGADSFAHPLHPPEHWDLRLLAAITTESAKDVSSRSAMQRTAETSPYFRAWCELIPGDLVHARTALAARDLPRLGALAESNCLRMHATALGASPPVLFWNPATVAVLREVSRLRQLGFAAWCTIDAGPHVKVICNAAQSAEITQFLVGCSGVIRVIESHPGPDAHLLG
jgi:diphosphomevalonate decarboxylase